jgi:hypothetical protein
MSLSKYFTTRTIKYNINRVPASRTEHLGYVAFIGRWKVRNHNDLVNLPVILNDLRFGGRAGDANPRPDLAWEEDFSA